MSLKICKKNKKQEKDKSAKSAEFLSCYLYLILKQQNFVMNVKKYSISNAFYIIVHFAKNEI